MNAWVLVTPKLSLLLPSACSCGRSLETESQKKTKQSRCSSSWLLSVQVAKTRRDAALVCLQWSCVDDALRQHSLWLEADAVVFAERHTKNLCRGPHEQPFEAENTSIRLWESPATGKFAVAAQQIPMGATALQAAAFAVVIKDSLARSHCHWCFNRLVKKVLQCADCQFARYCSRECLDADALLHDFQCQALGKLGSDSPQGSALYAAGSLVDSETVRLTLAVLSMERLLQTTKPLAPLVVHSKSALADDLTAKVVAGAVEIIQQNTSIDAPISAPHIRESLQRVQCNAHPLYLNGAMICGLGVFPEAAMVLNHSCMPNTVPSFDPKTRTLRFQTIRSIPAGHTIEYSYVELLQSTTQRQDQLRDGFDFECTCWRCVTKSEELKDRSSHLAEDAFTKELMQLQQSKHASQALSELKAMRKRCQRLLLQHTELRFGFHLVEMRLAAAARDWLRVIASAEAQIEIWRSEGLPHVYPIMQTLHKQIQLASTNAGLQTKAQEATQAIDLIQRVCGYGLPL